MPDASIAETLTDPALFLQQLAYNALQETVGAGVRATLGGEDIKDLLKDGLINVGVGTISQFIATKIGINRLAELRSEHADLTDYLLHKAYHGILGAARGAVSAALRGDNAGQAALGGCLGGITAEVIAESMRESVQDRIFERITNGETDIGKIRSEELARVSCLGQGAAVIMASLFNCDIAQAQGAAANAIENNWGQFLYYAAVGGMAMWTACDLYDTYRSEGAEAALTKAGVEIATAVVGGIVIKRGFIIAGRLYPSAEVAWGAYVAENPRMAAIAEYCVEKSGKAKDFCLEQGAKLSDHIKASGAGQFLSSINAKVEAKFAQWFGGSETGAAAGEYERFWTKHVEFKGNKVYQRDDLFDPNFVDKRGRTNIERMQKSLAPKGRDGESIELHHMLQTQDGPIAEVTHTFHRQYSSIIHINTPNIPSGINRPSFDKWRGSYWKKRSEDFK